LKEYNLIELMPILDLIQNYLLTSTRFPIRLEREKNKPSYKVKIKFNIKVPAYPRLDKKKSNFPDHVSLMPLSCGLSFF